ncbi:hypothetical protein HN695_07985 [Candidatus Woesearchaeota archaeon]|jgi:hypothetical protein|nr:hypothetical protein [Candidatus Woesearchaeota archaeon]MBT5272481.1 hypothetical protein [Candidatus Woesearchaeota archaeon]MBT6041511.1 hypothetical protein [Candidatus Woesearchaeota archaeon]MBT6336343.1 hypothetical protein [Candidatus Woesearchaeota archaeon]MBT7928245.1 hypothetical protein [Candidatus Woesearchaeota archaeon]
MRFNNLIGIVDDDMRSIERHMWYSEGETRVIEGVKYYNRNYSFHGLMKSFEKDPKKESRSFLDKCPGMCFINLELFVNKSLDTEDVLYGSWDMKKKLEQGGYKDLEISDNPPFKQVLEVLKKLFHKHGEIYFMDASLKKHSEIFKQDEYSNTTRGPVISMDLFEEYFSKIPIIRYMNRRHHNFTYSLFNYHEWTHIVKFADFIKETYEEDTSWRAKLKDKRFPESKVDRIIKDYISLIPRHEEDHKVFGKYYDRFRNVVRNNLMSE